MSSIYNCLVLMSGLWLPSHRADPRAQSLYNRHYSALKNARAAKANRWSTSICGPCADHMVMLTEACDALWCWQIFSVERLDHQEGIYCHVFRNEGPHTSSMLVREAEYMAWERWGRQRLFTYVQPDAITSSNPGYCFKVAGWKHIGQSKRGLHLLEKAV
jgi:hypothetical protein